MITAAERGEAMLARREHRRLQRRLDCLRPSRCKEEPIESRRQERRQPLEEPDANLGRVDVAHSVHEARGLIRDGSTDSRITVTGVRDAEGCRAIDVLVTVGIGDGCAVCRLPEDGNPRRDR